MASANASGMPVAFASNNPFRRAASPNPSASRSPDKQYIDNKSTMSRNPFLDPPSNAFAQKPSQDDTARLADDIFKNLSALDRSVSNGNVPRNAPPAPPKSGPMPTRPRDEDRLRDRAPKPRPTERNIFDTPDKTKIRRNSESSVMDKEKMDEERRRRHERRRERKEREAKEGKTKDSSKSSARPRKAHGLDVIDKLDVTGIYGQGFFHHDGPFDACNPHRNKGKGRPAPMQAFPVDSANNALGGGAPKAFDYDKFHGRENEGFNDFARSGQEYTAVPQNRSARETPSFNPTDRGEQIHGSATDGLGTSTFLEGAPASRTAVQRHASEKDDLPTQGNMGGLGRKKSLAMRIRGLSNQQRRDGDFLGEPGTSPNGRSPLSPYTPGYSQSAGGPANARPIREEKNPFFTQDYNDAYDKKGAQIREAEASTGGRPRALSSPKGAPLVRAVTADSPKLQQDSFDSKPAGGFLNRMRSIKGGKRARPDRA
ncbi:hypothetical protein MBLNU457_3446t1 [Dothideomycetes sp. NU457]